MQALQQRDPGPRSQTHLKSMVSKFFEERVAAWRVGSSSPGMESTPFAVEAQNLSCWTAREIPKNLNISI